MAKVLVTGVNGFVGQHLVRELHQRGSQIIGIGQETLAEPSVADLFSVYAACDLTDPDQVKKLPLHGLNAVLSLAGLANVGGSFSQPKLYEKVNVAVLSTLCEQLVNLKSEARVIAVSTGAVYDPAQALPLTETSKTVKQGSPYAQSKLRMEEAAQHFRSLGLDCVIARPFNHSGPGQRPGFLIPDLYQKLVSAKKLAQPVLVGNLNTRRDYTDVRDVVRAYASLALHSTPLSFDIYNLCSGQSVAGNTVMDLLLQNMRIEKMEVKVDPTLTRPDDPADIFGSYERLKQDVGWSPKIPFEQTIADFVAWQKAVNP